MKRAVVTMAVGRAGRDMLAISGPLLKRWAARIGAKFHSFDVRHSDYPCGEKFRYRGAVEHYDRTACIDADVILDPDTCPDIFEAVPPDSIGAHDDGPQIVKSRGELTWVQSETDAVCDSQGVPRFVVDHVWNSGIVVLSREHARFFEQPEKPYPAYHCSEQWWEWVNATRYGLKVTALPGVWNYQWWFDRRMPSAAQRPDIHIRHFAGMQPSNGSSHAERIRAMKRAAVEVTGVVAKARASRHGRRCLELLKRVDMTPGCQTGYNRLHECAKGHAAVPGASCQTCNDFDDDGPFCPA